MDAGVAVPGGPAVVSVLEGLIQFRVERGVDDDRLVPVVQADRWRGAGTPARSVEILASARTSAVTSIWCALASSITAGRLVKGNTLALAAPS